MYNKLYIWQTALTLTPNEITEHRLKRSQELKKLRTDNNIGKSQLSNACGIRRLTIDRMESGKFNWSIDTEIIFLYGINLLTKNQN